MREDELLLSDERAEDISVHGRESVNVADNREVDELLVEGFFGLGGVGVDTVMGPRRVRTSLSSLLENHFGAMMTGNHLAWPCDAPVVPEKQPGRSIRLVVRFQSATDK